MSFSTDWLALREEADRRSRNADLARRLAAHVSGRSELRVLDLGAGSGNNMRATAPLLPVAQHWTLLDSDAALLRAATSAPPPRVSASTRLADLAGEIEPLLRPAPHVVTASAFFDLCGSEWIDRFCAALTESGAALYAVLTYDGREVWEPSCELDAPVLEAFHADQRREKGLGPALGPEAHGALAETLRRRGYEVIEAESDWRLTRADAALIGALADGTAAAVAPTLGEERAAQWRSDRQRADRVLIGHRDLLALPPR